MENHQSNTESNSNVQEPNPEVTSNSFASAPLTALPPLIPLPSLASSSNTPYKVFISHAAEDRATIAIPLRERLQKRGITAFVDMEDMPPGTEAEQAMMHAMETASVGVFVMSPEFVARKWPMKGLMHFLKRFDECKAAGINGPTIVPFFYRLGISGLYDEPRLDRNDKDGNMLYEMSRFYERQRNGDPEANITRIKATLKKLHGIMGLENFVNANNDTSYKMSFNRNVLLDKLCNKICESVPGSTIHSAVTELASDAECDKFRAHFDKADDVSELVFDFDRKGSDGNACTLEGRILQVLIDGSMDRNRAITVHGMGGVGKTSLLRKIRNLDCVFERFKDGVYYIEMGEHATRKGLIGVLISSIWKSGGTKTALNMRKETDIRKVIEGFLSWFAEKQCLFVIDDVWYTKEMTLEIVHDMRNLHTSGQDSKTLLTTRSIDIATYCDACFCLKPREPLGFESWAILYHHAGLIPIQGQDKDYSVVYAILGRCAGLPLFLSMAGKAVKTLSFRSGHKGCMAYHVYFDQLKTSMGELITKETESYKGLQLMLKDSMELVEEGKGRFDFKLRGSMAEMHRRLSVLKKQMRVPMRMLKHLWEVEHESEAARIAKVFGEVGLADVEFEEAEGGVMEVLRLHDSIYESAVLETQRCKEEGVGHKKVLEGYGKALKKSGAGRQWWSKDLEDDNYIHRNVCRHLVGVGLEDELFGLLLSPEWLERQVKLNGIAVAKVDFTIGIEVTRIRKEKVRDVEDNEIEEALEIIREAITLSFSYILKNERELWFQVHGRLKKAGEWNKVVREYVTKIESDAQKPGVLCLNELLVGADGANTKIVPVGSGVECMASFNDKERVACGCWCGDIAIVNVRRGEIEMRLSMRKEAITAIDVGKGDTRIVFGSADGTTNVCDSQSGALVATFDGCKGIVRRVAITRDGKRLMSGYDDYTVQECDVESGTMKDLPIKDSRTRFTVFIDADCGMTGNLQARKFFRKIWNICCRLASTKARPSFRDHMEEIHCSAVTKDARHIVTGSLDGTVRLWDLKTLREVWDPFKRHCGVVRCIAMSDDGGQIASGSDDNAIRVWNVEGGEQSWYSLNGHTRNVTEVSFLEDAIIVSCSYDGTVRMWDLKRKSKEALVGMHSGLVSSVFFTPNGKYVVSGSWDGTLRKWDAISGQAVGEPMWEGKSSRVNGVALSPNGQFVVFVSEDRKVRVYDLQKRKVVRTLEGHTEGVQCVAVTPDGERAVTGSEDKTVRFWDLKPMEESHFILEGHKARVERVFVTDNGKQVISVDISSTIFVWDIDTRSDRERMTIEGAWLMSRRQVLGLLGIHTEHDEAGFSISRRGKEIVHGNEIVYGEGSEAAVLGTLDSYIMDWDISPDKQTICVGLSNGKVMFLRLVT